MSAANPSRSPLGLPTVGTDELTRLYFGAATTTLFQQTSSAYATGIILEETAPVHPGYRIDDILPGNE